MEPAAGGGENRAVFRPGGYGFELETLEGGNPLVQADDVGDRHAGTVPVEILDHQQPGADRDDLGENALQRLAGKAGRRLAEDDVGAALGRHARAPDALRRVGGGDREDNRDPPGILRRDRFGDGAELVPVEALALAGDGKDEHARRARCHRPVDQPPDAVEIDRIVRGERRVEAGDDAPDADRAGIFAALPSHIHSFGDVAPLQPSSTKRAACAVVATQPVYQRSIL